MQNRKAKDTSAVLICIYALFFVLSLSFHNHAFTLDPTGEKVSEVQQGNIHLSGEFCSGCRIGGDLKPEDLGNSIGHKPGVALARISSLGVLTPFLFLESSKNPRSPPTA